MARYHAGTTTMSDLLDAQTLYQQSRDKFVETYARYQSELVALVENMYKIFDASEVETMTKRNKDIIKEIAQRIERIEAGVTRLVDNRKVANKIETEREKAIAYHDTVAPVMDEIRYEIDKLELLVSDELWTLPKYRELLFIR